MGGIQRIFEKNHPIFFIKKINVGVGYRNELKYKMKLIDLHF
jgi:hypothetical protein